MIKNRQDIMTDGSVDFNKIRPTGELVIDTIMSSIYFYRKKGRSLKTIHLNTHYWSVFDRWCREFCSKDLKDEEKVEWHFDGVTIVKNFLRTNNELDFTFWNHTDMLINNSGVTNPLPTERKNLNK